MIRYNIVKQITPEVDPKTVLATTYQMRDIYTHLGTGFYSSGEIMNYIQHHAAIKDIKKHARVLDMCCGRAAVLPLLRYHKPQIASYIGIDIKESNISPAFKYAGTAKITAEKFALNYKGDSDAFYPFSINFITGNVKDAVTLLHTHTQFKTVDHIIYTAALEHMHKDDGVASLQAAFDLLSPGGTLFLSTPNTEMNAFNTQYKAHLYEWSLEEVQHEVENIGFQIDSQWGILVKASNLKSRIELCNPTLLPLFLKLQNYLPSEWLAAYIGLTMPEIADEVALKLTKPEN